jgi:hypothetical protein
VVEQPIEEASRRRGAKAIAGRVAKTIGKMEHAVGVGAIAGKFPIVERGGCRKVLDVEDDDGDVGG